MPSSNELDSLKSKAAFLLNYLFLQTEREYWSSSEYNQHGGAWIVRIPGGEYYGDKPNNAYVIPVRKF